MDPIVATHYGNYFPETTPKDNSINGYNFTSNLFLPEAEGERADRIRNRIDRRANRAIHRFNDGRMTPGAWNRLGGQHRRDVKRLDAIGNTPNWSGSPVFNSNGYVNSVRDYLDNIGFEIHDRKGWK
jgi:hypothetical protein